MNRRPLVVGLTGGIGAGKSLAAGLFRELGAHVVVADELVGRVLKDPVVLEEIRSSFGQSVLAPDGVDRAALADLVFSDRAARRRLELILHPRVAALAGAEASAAARAGVPVVVYEVPLLFEIGADQWVDEVVVVHAEESVRVRRLVEQRGFSEKDARARIRTQITDHGSRAGVLVLDNDGSVDALRSQVRRLYGSWLSSVPREDDGPGMDGSVQETDGGAAAGVSSRRGGSSS